MKDKYINALLFDVSVEVTHVDDPAYQMKPIFIVNETVLIVF